MASGAQSMSNIFRQYTQAEVLAMTEKERKAAKVSRYFSLWEVECHCGCGNALMHPRQMQAMDALREHIGQALLIRWGVGGESGSGFRCVSHNLAIGGEKNSYHLKGLACDCRANGLTVHELAAAALAVPGFRQGGIGIYPRGGKRGWVHLDFRATGTPARWVG